MYVLRMMKFICRLVLVVLGLSGSDWNLVHCILLYIVASYEYIILSPLGVLG